MTKTLKSLTSKELVELIKGGAVGVLPTDTVYGLVCRAADPAAVERLYKLKRRHDKPGTLIAAKLDQLVELGIKYAYLKAVEQFWPDAVSVVVPSSDPKASYLRQGRWDIAVRLPKDQDLQKLLVQTGPLLTTSANQPGQPPAGTIAAARKYFADQLDFYVDGGNLSDRQPSTIIRVVDDAIEVLRPGAVKIKDNQ